MLFVDLWIPPDDFAAQMGDMRIWLDRHQIKTSGFSLKDSIARVAFRQKMQAEAFALQFGGRVFPIADKPGNGELSETLPIAAPLPALAVALAAARRETSLSVSGLTRLSAARPGRERVQRNSNTSKTIRTIRPTPPPP